jgi:hypothetical protein
MGCIYTGHAASTVLEIYPPPEAVCIIPSWSCRRATVNQSWDPTKEPGVSLSVSPGQNIHLRTERTIIR